MTAYEALQAMLDRTELELAGNPSDPVGVTGLRGRIDELWLSSIGRKSDHASDAHVRARIVDPDGRVYHVPVEDLP